MLSLAAAFAERKRKKRRKKKWMLLPVELVMVNCYTNATTIRRYIYTRGEEEEERVFKFDHFENFSFRTGKGRDVEGLAFGKVATRDVSPDLRQWYGGEVVYFPSNMASPFGRIGFEGCSTIFASPLSLSPFSSGFVSH